MTVDPVETAPVKFKRERWRRSAVAFGGLGALVLVGTALNLTVGAVAVPFGDVVSILGDHLGITGDSGVARQADAVVWNIRMPRTITGIVVGAGLGAAGAALQGLFRNPLADGQLLGIGPGASLGAVTLLAFAGSGADLALAGGAAGGILTALLIRRLDARSGSDPLKTVVVGIALGAALSAWVGFAVFALDRGSVPPVEFWLLGSLTGSTGPVAVRTFVVTAVGFSALLATAGGLDAMALGRRDAQHLGVDTRMITALVLLAVGAIVGVSVGAAGVIGFVGLLAPHLARPLVGSRALPAIVASTLIGAILVGVADLVSRNFVLWVSNEPIEIPVGVVTASIGGPFFVWLLQRTRRVVP